MFHLAAMFDSVATPLFLTFVLIVLVVLAVYGFLEPRRFPCMAALLAKFGLQPKADAVVVTVTEAKLPPGDFVVQFKCGDQSFDARPSKDGEFSSSSWVDIERRCVYCEVVVLVDGEPAVVKQVKATEILMTAKKAPHTLVVRLPGGELDQPLGTVTLRVDLPSNERTPLLESISADSRRLKAAVATQDFDSTQETEVLQKLLTGPITCLGNDAKWCRIENRPRNDRALWFWCFYSQANATGDALWVLPVASIVDIKATERNSFEVTARDQSKKETLFFRVPGEVGIWVEGLKALRDSARYDENVARRKSWMGMSSEERKSTWQSHEAVAKNV